MEATSETRAAGAASWAGQALMVTAVIAVVAKIVGVLVAPGLHGVVSQPVIETIDTASAAFAYLLAALLVALVCASTFELARVRRIGGTARGLVIGISGLVVALASPAVVTRLHTVASLALAVTTSASVLVAGIVAVRASHTRAIGALLSMLALCALVRVVGWELAAIGAERPAPTLFTVGRVLATVAVFLHAVSVLLAAAWLGTRAPKLQSRILANVAIALGFIITYFALRTTEGTPSSSELVLRVSLTEAAGMPLPYVIGSVGAFLVPSSIFLAIVALVTRRESPALIAGVALALLSHGAFDIPMHALLATAAAQWGMLAMVERAS
jgi:hypothetical protein